MIPNYHINQHGIIQQIERRPFLYDEHYIENSFNRYGGLGDMMSHLRLGYLLGSLGHIPQSLLDVGYGNGNFLRLASQQINDCCGNDIQPAYGLPDNIKFQDNLYSRSYDVVTFFDSLEHFPDIYEIAALQATWVIITLPWCHGRDQGSAWFQNWKHRKPDEHLWHFDAKALQEFMTDLGYQTINFCALEDTIRGHGADGLTNILTGCFQKR